MSERWKLLDIERVYEDNILKVEHHNYYYEREKGSVCFSVVNMFSLVIVVPMLSNGNLLLVRQFRAGRSDFSYEFPGGAVAPGEGFINAGERELLEETGCVSKEISFIKEINPNPAFVKSRCGIILAENCETVSELNLDRFEDIEVVEVSPEELERMIIEGKIYHGMMIAAWFLCKLEGKR